MIDNQPFIEATNFIKNKRKITFGEIAIKIGINQGRMDNLRRNGVPLDLTEAQELTRHFPEVLKFFTENRTENKDENNMKNLNNDTVHEPLVLYSDGNAWKEAFLTQKKLIELQTLELERLRRDVERLSAENNALKAIFKERDKKS